MGVPLIYFRLQGLVFMSRYVSHHPTKKGTKKGIFHLQQICGLVMFKNLKKGHWPNPGLGCSIFPFCIQLLGYPWTLLSWQQSSTTITVHVLHDTLQLVHLFSYLPGAGFVGMTDPNFFSWVEGDTKIYGDRSLCLKPSQIEWFAQMAENCGPPKFGCLKLKISCLNDNEHVDDMVLLPG